MKKPEIMSPIRDWSSLEACKKYADAVYFGLSDLTMRANADAFNLKNIGSFARKCHDYKIKAYLTVNSTVYNNDIKRVEKIIKKAKEAGIDALIVWDPAAIEIARKEKIKFFISTQANISNWKSALFYKKLGAKRLVLARELTLKQIKAIKEKANVEIETFVHGAMCLSISGRCILSAYLYGKSANCGSCAQPCRKKWFLVNEEGKKIVNRGKFFLSAKDLCMIEYMPDLIRAGIDAFKIEGRRRDARYIEVTSRCYREAVDAYFSGNYTEENIQRWKKELSRVYNRGFSTGFYFGIPGKEGISYDYDGNISRIKKVLVGNITHYYPRIEVAEIVLSHKGLHVGQEIIIEGKKTYLKQKIWSMQKQNKDIQKGIKGELIAVKVKIKVKKNDKVFILE